MIKIFRVGRGIVWDSTAQDEWDETLQNKIFELYQDISDIKLVETMLVKGGQIQFEGSI
jgi:anthranilate/para-aminobenzoate synthase component I